MYSGNIRLNRSIADTGRCFHAKWSSVLWLAGGATAWLTAPTHLCAVLAAAASSAWSANAKTKMSTSGEREKAGLCSSVRPGKQWRTRIYTQRNSRKSKRFFLCVRYHLGFTRRRAIPTTVVAMFTTEAISGSSRTAEAMRNVKRLQHCTTESVAERTSGWLGVPSTDLVDFVN